MPKSLKGILVTARCLELDLLDVLEMDPEGKTDAHQLVKRISGKIGILANELEDKAEIAQQQVVDALRWQLLTRPDVQLVWREGCFQLHSQGKGPGGFYREHLATGTSIADVIDKALKLKLYQNGTGLDDETKEG